MKDYIKEKEEVIGFIKEERNNIAQLKMDKAESRKDAWIDATGTAKEKEDYVRSRVAEIDTDIRIAEAEIEYYYNLLGIIEDKMIYHE